MDETVVLSDVTKELMKSAEDALARNFAIIACKPHAKDPWPLYSPNACHSGKTVPAIALKPWLDGTEANYGVSCGMSNITVVDADHGLNSHEEFLAWRKEFNLPETFTVLSGRADGYGVHMYYTGTVDTSAFKIGNVTGELKGKGGYVVGPGSIHPSGKKYTIIVDTLLAPLPEGLITLSSEKKALNYVPKSAGGEMIAAGSRWIHLQSLAGKLRNAGLGENGIYQGLKDFLKENCEDGENYPEDKITALAHAAVTKFDAAEVQPIVFFDDNPETLKQTGPAETPPSVIEGDWIGDLTTLLTKGTSVPPSFVRANIKTILGASVDGMVGFPGQVDLHTRIWTMVISAHPEAGKGVSWFRSHSALLGYINKTGLKQPPAGIISSGENLIKVLSEYEGSKTIINFDEMKVFFDKAQGDRSTLLPKMTELYEQTSGAAGSLSNPTSKFNDVSLSFKGDFTLSSFDSALAGKGAGGDGFLSRSILDYSKGVPLAGDWPEIDTVATLAIAEKMTNRWNEILAKLGGTGVKRFVPTETEGANKLRGEFSNWITEEKKAEADGYVNHTSRLEAHFKRDLLLRALFSDNMEITEDMVKRSIEWAKHQLILRRRLYPVDKGNAVERMEQGVRRSLLKHNHMTKAKIQDMCHVFRAGSGGMAAFNIAWTALLRGGTIEPIGRTHKGTEKFSLCNEN